MSAGIKYFLETLLPVLLDANSDVDSCVCCSWSGLSSNKGVDTLEERRGFV